MTATMVIRSFQCPNCNEYINTSMDSTLSIFRGPKSRWHKSFVFNARLFESPLFDSTLSNL
jgi:hypothetical protein